MMHGQKNIKLHNVKQAKPVHQYKDTKIKLYKNNAAIWYNKTCKRLLSTGVVYSRLWERGNQTLCLCSCSSWGWACQGPKHVEDSSVTYTLLLNCALKLVEEIVLYYDARSKKHQIYIGGVWLSCFSHCWIRSISIYTTLVASRKECNIMIGIGPSQPVFMC